MNFFVYIFVFLVLSEANAMAASQVESASSSIPTPLQELQKKFSKSSGFEVNFTQEIKQDIFPDQNDKAAGHIQFSRPQSLVWKYKSPHERTIRYDGKFLTIEEQGEKQIVRDNGQVNLQESFAFLWGQPNPKVFLIEPKDSQSFLVRPKDPARAGFKSIDVRIKNGLVEEARVINQLDSESKLEFSQWKIK